MYYQSDISLQLSIVEILLISVIAFIGSFIHEYISFIRKGKRITLTVWGNIFTTVFVDVIICISIDPFVSKLHPRFILLPPLLIGLAGSELITKLTTLSGVTKVIEYVLGFFHITKPEENSVTLDLKDNEKDVESYDLGAEVDKVIAQVEILIREYNLDKDADNFMEEYKFVEKQVQLIKDKFENKLIAMPEEVSIRMLELIKAEVSLKKIYKKITRNQTKSS